MPCIFFCIQGLFRKVTGKNMLLAFRRNCFIYSVCNISVGIAISVFIFLMDTKNLWLLPFTFLVSTTIGAFGVYRVASYVILTIAGQNLVSNFKVSGIFV